MTFNSKRKTIRQKFLNFVCGGIAPRYIYLKNP